jgi:PAS domain S-box-containing protein
MEDTRYKILLIEDDKLDQMAFMRMVESEELPYDCTKADSVSEAKKILGSEQFDIVISDYSLGDGTAFDILDLVKNTPVILVTGAGDEAIAIKAWKAGAYDYLVKDVERNYLKTVPITVENSVGHKKTEAKLQLLSEAVMSTDDSVYITDLENKVIFVNRAFCETYGYKEEEIIGKNSDIFCGEEVFDGDQAGSYHTRKDGDKFPVSLSNSAIKNENGDEISFVGVARDISERVFIEDKVRNLNLKLKKGIRQMG